MAKNKKIVEVQELVDVVFWDIVSDFKYKTKSTRAPKETIAWEDGKEYPVIKFEISSASHPVYTGKIDSGRLDRANQVAQYKKRMEEAKKKQDEMAKRAEKKSQKTTADQEQSEDLRAVAKEQ